MQTTVNKKMPVNAKIFLRLDNVDEILFLIYGLQYIFVQHKSYKILKQVWYLSKTIFITPTALVDYAS